MKQVYDQSKELDITGNCPLTSSYFKLFLFFSVILMITIMSYKWIGLLINFIMWYENYDLPFSYSNLD